jgi:hypothetical protein
VAIAITGGAVLRAGGLSLSVQGTDNPVAGGIRRDGSPVR